MCFELASLLNRSRHRASRMGGGPSDEPLAEGGARSVQSRGNPKTPLCSSKSERISWLAHFLVLSTRKRLPAKG